MKKILLAAALAFFMIPAQAQEIPANPKKKNSEAMSSFSKPSRDFLMFQLNWNSLMNTPDSLKLKQAGRGVNVYLCYDFPFKNSNFSFAAGLGVGVYNYYFDKQVAVLNDTSSSIIFRNQASGESLKNPKLNATYLEAPFELRYFGNKYDRNKGFKAAIGMRIGTNVGAHSKYKHTVSGSNVIEKTNTRRYMENWNVAGTLRLGWGNFSAVGSYSLSPLFKEGKGPDVTPYSIGICITGL